MLGWIQAAMQHPKMMSHFCLESTLHPSFRDNKVFCHQSNRTMFFNSAPDLLNGQTVNYILNTPKVIESRIYVKKADLEHY